MRPLLQEMKELEREHLRLERWRETNRPHHAIGVGRAAQAPSPVCDRCGREACGTAEFAVLSDALAMRVGFRCAVEAWLLREAFPTAVGRIRIDVIQ